MPIISHFSLMFWITYCSRIPSFDGSTRTIYLLTVLLLGSADTSSPVNLMAQHLICNGLYSNLTHSECQGQFHNIPAACYFVENFNYYRSCADLCNDVAKPSREEQRCNFRCPGILITKWGFSCRLLLRFVFTCHAHCMSGI